MGKLTYEEAVKKAEKATETRKAAQAAKETFASENGLKAKKDHSEDPKHGKAWKKLKQAHLDAKDAEIVAQAAAKELKPVTVRESKYEYPADCVTDLDKKKYRAKMRAEKNKADKPAKTEKPAKEEKSKKAKKEEEAPAETSKKKKKKVKAETSDED